MLENVVRDRKASGTSVPRTPPETGRRPELPRCRTPPETPEGVRNLGAERRPGPEGVWNLGAEGRPGPESVRNLGAERRPRPEASGTSVPNGVRDQEGIRNALGAERRPGPEGVRNLGAERRPRPEGVRNTRCRTSSETGKASRPEHAGVEAKLVRVVPNVVRDRKASRPWVPNVTRDRMRVPCGPRTQRRRAVHTQVAVRYTLAFRERGSTLASPSGVLSTIHASTTPPFRA